MHFCRHPLPTRACGKGYSYTSAGIPSPPVPAAKDTHALLPAPPPHPRLRQEIPIPFCRPPPPRPRLRQEIPIPFCRQPPPRPRLRRRIPILFCRHPHPTRAFGAPPPPRPGAGAVLAISGEQPYPGYSRWKAVSGSFPPIPWHWTVGISPLGERLTGRGNLFPLPCLPHFNHLTSRQHPLPAPPPAATHALLPAAPTPPAPAAKDTHTLLPAAPTPPTPSVGDTHTLLPAPPPHPRLRRSSPTPAGGRGSERRYPVGSRIRGGAWWAAVPGSSPAVLLIRVLHGLA